MEKETTARTHTHTCAHLLPGTDFFNQGCTRQPPEWEHLLLIFHALPWFPPWDQFLCPSPHRMALLRDEETAEFCCDADLPYLDQQLRRNPPTTRAPC